MHKRRYILYDMIDWKEGIDLFISFFSLKTVKWKEGTILFYGCKSKSFDVKFEFWIKVSF